MLVYEPILVMILNHNRSIADRIGAELSSWNPSEYSCGKFNMASESVCVCVCVCVCVRACVRVCVCSTANCTDRLIQQNDGSGFFNRSWVEFKVGFGDPSGNYWLGNDLLSQLTANYRYKLRFDLQSLQCLYDLNLVFYWFSKCVF